MSAQNRPIPKTPYETLGVAKTANQEEIKNAYRNLAKKLHPDLNPGNKVTEEQFKLLSAAYEQIGTPEARAKYDRGETLDQKQDQAYRNRQGPYYHETQRDGGRYSHTFEQSMGGEDFFENLFRSAGQGYAKADRVGQDHLYQMTIDFKDAILGAEREIALPSGKRLKVTIPPGVETGNKLRFREQGGPGHGSGPAGDAYVEITVKSQPGFKRIGPDLETELPISFIEAINGAEIKVPTLEGAVLLTLPPGVSTGSRLKIRGKGVASPKTPGDQIVVLRVVMPTHIEPGLAEAVKSWSGKYDYNPREAL